VRPDRDLCTRTAGKYNGSLTGKDLHYDSPYNTYEHGGLPPGPIGNPGEVALRAALAPAQTDYLYFVANTQGGHFFGAPLASEHNTTYWGTVCCRMPDGARQPGENLASTAKRS